jgi:hypothetical protein
MRYSCTQCLAPIRHVGLCEMCASMLELNVNSPAAHMADTPGSDQAFKYWPNIVYVKFLKEKRGRSYACARRMAGR